MYRRIYLHRYNIYTYTFVCAYICVYEYIYYLLACIDLFMYIPLSFLLFQFSIFFNKNLSVYNVWSGHHTHEFLHWTYSDNYQTLTGRDFVERNVNTPILVTTVGVGASHMSCLAFYKQISANPVHNRQSHYYKPPVWKAQLFLNAFHFAANKSVITPR